MSQYNERAYVIVPTAQLTQAMVDACIQSRLDTVRRSVSGTQCVLKWRGDAPPVMTAFAKRNHRATLALMATPAWTDPNLDI